MLSAQQTLVLEEKRLMLSMLDGARDTLDARGLGLVQAAGLVLVLAGVVRLPGFVLAPVDQGWALAAVAVAFLAFGGMVGLFLGAMAPLVYTLPGTLDWDELGERYLGAEEEDCFNQVLSNLIEAIEKMMAVNRRKGRCLRWAIGLFLVQVVGLLAMAVSVP